MRDVRQLVLRARGGDRHASADLYDQFAPLVRSVAYDATGCLQEAEDLCQEVFLRAFQNLKELRDAARFPGWLMTIARRTCINWSRQRKRRSEIGLEKIETPAITYESNDDEVRQMLDAIRRLPAKERMALHLFYLAEEPAELARQTMGLSSAGFYKVLDHAKRRVAALLQERNVTR